MDTRPYTLAKWVAREGMEDEFVARWKALGRHFLSLPEPPGVGTLLRSVENRRVFYSMGPWPSMDAIAAMRAHPATAAAFERLREVCEEMAPGAYTVEAQLGEE